VSSTPVSLHFHSWCARDRIIVARVMMPRTGNHISLQGIV
jgi:hypothetical protein